MSWKTVIMFGIFAGVVLLNELPLWLLLWFWSGYMLGRSDELTK